MVLLPELASDDALERRLTESCSVEGGGDGDRVTKGGEHRWGTYNRGVAAMCGGTESCLTAGSCTIV